MRIEKLHLKNFRCFEDLEINFPESNLAVFIGLNGSGKTAILKALSLSLSQLVARIESEKEKENSINSLDIFNDFRGFGLCVAKIISTVEENSLHFQLPLEIWPSLSREEVRKREEARYAHPLNDLSNRYRERLEKNSEASLPLIMSYSVKRTISEIDLEIREGQLLKQFEGYENCFLQQADFKRFFSWYREREDMENERFAQVWREKKAEIDGNSPDDKQLKGVRTAIHAFIPEFSNLRVERMPLLRMLVDKKGTGKPLNILQLSDGEKSLMALVGDIARRLAIMNPKLEDPLNGEGVVLIDEIELHLHPQWQREVLPALQKTFPNIQFIVTTHSPQVLSRVHKDDIFILKDNKLYQPSSNPVGRDSTDILDEIMEVTKRPEEIQKLSDKYFSFINKNQFEEAQKIREKLLVLVKNKKLDKDDSIFIRADAVIARKQMLQK